MGAFLASIAVAILVTWLAARWRVKSRPGASFMSHVVVATAAFPLVALVLFVLLTAYTLLGADMDKPGAAANVGMPIVAMVFFLFYAGIIAVVVGLPTAIVTVRSLQGGQG